MPRPRRDGTPPAPPRKQKLNQLLLSRLRPHVRSFLVWDSVQRGLAIRVRPTGAKSWYALYVRQGRPRWYRIGDANAIGLADARKLAGRIMYQVAEGADPAAERKAHQGQGTFQELAAEYVGRFAKKHNKAWRQSEALVRRHALPRWGKLKAAQISRADVKTLFSGISSPSVANQVLAAVSRIFNWGIAEEIVAVNPCRLIEANKMTDRERVLAESEFKMFWDAFDDVGLLEGTLLKLILLTGQRPGEVCRMHRQHIVDGWWSLPGEPVPAANWVGTKNGHSHRVWLPKPAQALLAELDGNGSVFAGPNGKPIERVDDVMRGICKRLGVENKVTPHDLRRTHGSTITGMGFGRPAMNRIQNHVEGGIADVYDQHTYAVENKTIMEAVAARIMALVEGRPVADNVVPLPARGA